MLIGNTSVWLGSPSVNGHTDSTFGNSVRKSPRTINICETAVIFIKMACGLCCVFFFFFFFFFFFVVVVFCFFVVFFLPFLEKNIFSESCQLIETE